MSLQTNLEVSRWLKETRPDLRLGSHDWWAAFRQEIENPNRCITFETPKDPRTMFNQK